MNEALPFVSWLLQNLWMTTVIVFMFQTNKALRNMNKVLRDHDGQIYGYKEFDDES